MLLEMVGLEAVQDRPVGEYSKGMQRRIGLAQSLINDPQLLILDEPTSGMDPVGAHQIKELISTLARRGKTVLLCSHLLGDVEDLCDRVAIMYGGRIRAEGTCAELLTQRHVTVLETEELSPDLIGEVRGLLSRHERTLTRVDHPRRSLESLFLEIVAQARAEGARTAGAGAGGPVAGFLAAGEPSAQAAGAAGGPPDAALLDSLTRRS